MKPDILLRLNSGIVTEKFKFHMKMFSKNLKWMHVMADIWDIESIYEEILYLYVAPKIVSAYDQEIPQSQTADYPVAPRGIAVQLSRDTRKTN